MHTEIAGEELVGSAVEQAKSERKQVLLVFGANWNAWCQRLDECFKQNEEIAARLRERYVIRFIDVENAATGRRNAGVVSRYCPFNACLPVLVAVDADGLPR